MIKNNTELVQTILKWTFGLVPIVAGLDKFIGLLADWGTYVPGFVSNMLPFSPEVLMMIVGVIEIVAGILVLSKFTRIGAYVVSAWLILIALNLIAAGYYDIAVRDVVMAISAFCLGKLSE